MVEPYGTATGTEATVSQPEPLLLAVLPTAFDNRENGHTATMPSPTLPPAEPAYEGGVDSEVNPGATGSVGTRPCDDGDLAGAPQGTTAPGNDGNASGALLIPDSSKRRRIDETVPSGGALVVSAPSVADTGAMGNGLSFETVASTTPAPTTDFRSSHLGVTSAPASVVAAANAIAGSSNSPTASALIPTAVGGGACSTQPEAGGGMTPSGVPVTTMTSAGDRTEANNNSNDVWPSLDTPITPAVQMMNTRRLLNLLPKDTIIDLLCKATAAHADVAETTDAVLESCSACRRLMVRNVSFTTENDSFHRVFTRLGAVEDYTIVREKDTRRSKGFGFVTFKRLVSVRAALARPVTLDGRELQIKLAAGDLLDSASDSAAAALAAGTLSGGSGGSSVVSGGLSGGGSNAGLNGSMGGGGGGFSSGSGFSSGGPEERVRRKLFIRNLSDTTTTDRLRSVFSEFGEIEDCIAVTDHYTGRSKGYGFVTFVRPQDAARVLLDPQRSIDGQMTFITYAAPDSGGSHRHGGGRGGGGGGGGAAAAAHRQQQQHALAAAAAAIAAASGSPPPGSNGMLPPPHLGPPPHMGPGAGSHMVGAPPPHAGPSHHPHPHHAAAALYGYSTGAPVPGNPGAPASVMQQQPPSAINPGVYSHHRSPHMQQSLPQQQQLGGASAAPPVYYAPLGRNTGHPQQQHGLVGLQGAPAGFGAAAGNVGGATQGVGAPASMTSGRDGRFEVSGSNATPLGHPHHLHALAHMGVLPSAPTGAVQPSNQAAAPSNSAAASQPLSHTVGVSVYSAAPANTSTAARTSASVQQQQQQPNQQSQQQQQQQQQHDQPPPPQALYGHPSAGAGVMVSPSMFL